MAAQQGSPALELGCGTGRVLVPLARAGCRVVGLDHSAAVLAHLRRNLPPHLQPAVQLVQADLTAFHFGVRFPLIYLPCNTYSMIPAQGRRDALSCVRRHLARGGIFAFSIPNPGLLQHLPFSSEPEIEESFPHPLDGEPVQVSSAWKRGPAEITITWHYDHLLPDGRVERASLQAHHFIVPVEAYLEELEQAGLQVMKIYGDFDGSAFRSGAPNFIPVLKNGQRDGA